MELPDNVATEVLPEDWPVAINQEWYLEHIWARSCLDADPDLVDNIYFASKLTIALDVRGFSDAVDAVVRAHQMLRASLSSMSPGARIRVAPPTSTGALKIEDFTTSGDPWATAMQRVRALARSSIDPTVSPTFQPVLFVLGESDFIFLFRLHHFAADAWSLKLIFEQLWAIYSKARVIEDDYHYADFISEQSQDMTPELLERRTRFWADTVAPPETPLALPSYTARGNVSHFRQGLVPFKIPSDWTEVVRKIAVESRVTVYTVLLAMYVAALQRYGPVEEIRIGSTLSARERPEHRRMVGPAYHFLVYRIRVGDNPTARDLLLRVRESASHARENRLVSHWGLIESQGLRRRDEPVDLIQFYDCYFDFMPRKVGKVSSDGDNPFSASPINLPHPISTFPLPESESRRQAWQQDNIAFNLRESERGIDGEVTFNECIFSAVQAEEFASNYLSTLAWLSHNLDRRISSAPDTEPI
jgi:hypothetical protein